MMHKYYRNIHIHTDIYIHNIKHSIDFIDFISTSFLLTFYDIINHYFTADSDQQNTVFFLYYLYFIECLNYEILQLQRLLSLLIQNINI